MYSDKCGLLCAPCVESHRPVFLFPLSSSYVEYRSRAISTVASNWGSCVRISVWRPRAVVTEISRRYSQSVGKTLARTEANCEVALVDQTFGSCAKFVRMHHGRLKKKVDNMLLIPRPRILGTTVPSAEM
jgi:hypothetical protein